MVETRIIQAMEVQMKIKLKAAMRRVMGNVSYTFLFLALSKYFIS
jgi:hypothetical protein